MRRGHVLLGAAALVAMVVVAYVPAFEAGYVWDDHDYVVANTNLVRPDGLRRIWFEPRRMVQYYPLVHTVLRGEYALWQLNPRGYHVVNVLLHAMNAILVWLLLRRLAVPGAWVAAGIFAVHPVHVESVAWITEIKNLLSGFFALACMLVYLRFHESAGVRPRWSLYALAVFLFLLALTSKATVVTLPVVLLLVLWWKSGRARLAHTDVLRLVPFLALSLAFGGLVWWLETFHVGSENVLALGVWDRILIPARAAWFYAAKLLVPANLVFVYPRWSADPGVWWQWMFPLALAGVVAAAWYWRMRVGKGVLVAVLVFLVTLAPVSGLVRFYFQLYSFVGDHFQYLASIAVIALVTAGGARALDSRHTAGRVVIVALLAALATLTWTRSKVYASEETLWRDTLEHNPAAWIAHNNLGVAYLRQGRKDEAAERFAATLRLNPSVPEAHSNLGLIEQGRGNAERAIAAYRAALALKPSLYDTQYNLGLLLIERGEMEEAARAFEAALAHRPSLAEAHMKLGDIHAAQGRYDPAVERYRAALAGDPALTKVLYRLGWVLVARGSFAEARQALDAAVRANPRDADAVAMLGVALENLGDPAGAAREYARALALDAANDVARQGLARATGQP